MESGESNNGDKTSNKHTNFTNYNVHTVTVVLQPKQNKLSERVCGQSLAKCNNHPWDCNTADHYNAMEDRKTLI